MKTKNIFKALAAAMLLPAMLLTTACSSEDDFVNNENTENTVKKGYTLPVTINVTRRGDATTRAMFDGSKLNFSSGDLLFVVGEDDSDGGAGSFAGTLTWQSGETFSGTVTTENAFSGTVDVLFTQGEARAYLLPSGYKEYGYLSIEASDGYDDQISLDDTKAIAPTKAEAVEQLSLENGDYTSGSGFELAPDNVILNFTITDLKPSTDVDVALVGDDDYVFSHSVSTDASGTATFALGVPYCVDLNECTMTVDGNVINLVNTAKGLERGCIYNINRANPLTVPLTIVALDDYSSITVSNPNGMQYSTDGGTTRMPVSGEITLEKAGDKVQFYGTATAYGESETTIGGTGMLKVYGNIMSLVDENNFATNTTLTAPFTFTSLFQGNHSLTDASGLLLPATKLKESCYESMFSGCENLVAGPNLPATTLKEFCYASMFLGCTSLVAGPNLPATTLTKYCYSYMFSGCTSLTSLTCLATNIYASGCIDHWLNGVTTTGTLYVDESMTEVNWNLPNDDWSVTEKP